ncbi:MAG: hypothetical protein ACPHJ3_01935 [Rubripirellula sp.]
MLQHDPNATDYNATDYNATDYNTTDYNTTGVQVAPPCHGLQPLNQQR